ncbi:MAG: hypothetical protein HYZ63_00100 [Candidatus Andersenbacteria bacterium]|nr:hypothetical protein [Candidatus Andersenbacteria bacterium]
MARPSRWLEEGRLDIALIVVLAILTLATRLPIAAERKIMPAGDAFNFQHIATQIQYGEYPAREKRLPAFPVFILIGRTLGFDPIKTSITISLLASTGTICTLYALGRVFQFNRAALVGGLGLAMFDPLLVVNGIRPLSDALFVFLVSLTYFMTALFLRYPAKATSRLQHAYSLTLVLLMFTRYEGFLIATLTAPFLFISLPWKQVLRMAILPTIAVLLWIPAYRAIHGSVGGLSYVTDATAPGGGFGELALLPDNFGRLMNGAGWKRVWTYPQEVFEKEVSAKTISTLLTSEGWWVGVLSILGLVFMLIRGRFAGFSILLAALGYALLLAWWWVYSRYVAPLSIIFYFGVAGGLAMLTEVAASVTRRFTLTRLTPLTALIPLLAVPILLSQVPKLHNSTLSQAWESNRHGYATYRALIFAAHQDGLVLYPTKEHANATLYFGELTQPKSQRNPHRGIYLSDWPQDTPSQLFSQLENLQPTYIIETDFDKRLPELVAKISQAGLIARTHEFAYTRWNTLDREITNVYELSWPQ